MLTIWRRHTAECPHRKKGRNYLKCNCPIWADGYVNGKRTLRVSLKTRDTSETKEFFLRSQRPKGLKVKDQMFLRSQTARVKQLFWNRRQGLTRR